VPAPIDLPREIAPGIFWLTECYALPYNGRIIHSYNSAFLVAGDRHCAIIETGIAGDTVLFEQLESLSDRGLPDLRYVFVTHSEMAHAGGVGPLLARHPSATVHGEVSDLHLVWPEVADRLYFAEPGERFDLGGTEIVVVEGVFRDLVHSRWFFDTRRKALFPGDGFAYSHYHEDGACGHLAEEVPELDIQQGMERFSIAAFHWTGFVDIEPFILRLDELVAAELAAELIAPSHGLPIGAPAATLGEIKAGLRSIRSGAAG
jgi:flavorubredoxin